MRVTVCELNNAPDVFARDWEQLVAHVKLESSELVLLPEMPFCSWFAVTEEVNAAVWLEVFSASQAPRTVLRAAPVSHPADPRKTALPAIVASKTTEPVHPTLVKSLDRMSGVFRFSSTKMSLVSYVTQAGPAISKGR
jgi:hypothetical protein